MKTPKQWVDEFTQSGAFDLVESCEHAQQIVAAIQRDVIDDIAGREVGIVGEGMVITRPILTGLGMSEMAPYPPGLDGSGRR